ncbi:MAG: hypothetical protein WDM87_09010 [Terracidiphilus sp.]
MAVGEILQHLDDELFYAILDVALDLQTEVHVGTTKIYIPFKRPVVRYEILLPGITPGALDRYCGLRWKACGFLQKHSVISGYTSTGNEGWDGVIEIKGIQVAPLADLLVELRSEEDRRNPQLRLKASLSSGIARVVQLAESFHRAALKLQKRHAQRAPFVVEDEFDVQDLFGALLETRFDEVRPEEYGPSHAGAASRVDFLLKQESIVVETKMAREGLTDKKLGEELIIDIERYKHRPDCKSLLCFVYDPDFRLKNPSVLENDLTKRTDGLYVRTLIRPKR